MKKILLLAAMFLVGGIFIGTTVNSDLQKKAFAKTDRCITSFQRHLRRADKPIHVNGAFRRFKSCIENYAWKEKPKCLTVCAAGKNNSHCAKTKPGRAEAKKKCLAEVAELDCEKVCTKP